MVVFLQQNHSVLQQRPQDKLGKTATLVHHCTWSFFVIVTRKQVWKGYIMWHIPCTRKRQNRKGRGICRNFDVNHAASCWENMMTAVTWK